jgi:hypothetical protein
MTPVSITTMVFAVGSIYGGLIVMLYLAVTSKANQEDPD